MKNPFYRIFIFCSVGLLITASGLAQRQTGGITGRVLDEAKDPLPGVTVTLSGSALMGTRDVVSSETGAFRFAALSPGSDFQLKVALPGFNTIIRPGIIVKVGGLTDVEIIMEISPVSVEITVIAPSPVIDVQSTKTNVNYSAQFLASLPMNRDLYDIQNSVPGAIADGVNYRRTSSILGGTVRSQSYNLDGVPMNDPATSYSAVNINVDIYEEIEFELGGHPAEVGQTDAGYINIISKSGSNKLSGGVTGYYTSKSLAEDLFSEEQLEALGLLAPQKNTVYKDLSINLGGSIIKDKIWFFLAGRRLDWEKINPYTPEARMAAMGFDSPHYDLSHKEWMGFSKLTFQITPHLKVMAMLNYNYLHEPYSSANSYTSIEYSRIYTDKAYALTSQVNWVLNQDTFLDIRGSYVVRPFTYHARNEGAYTYFSYTPYVYWGTAGYNVDYLRNRLIVSASMTRLQDDLLGANHEFKAGLEFEQGEYHQDWYRVNPYYSYWSNYASSNPYYYSSANRQGRLRIRFCPTEPGQWDIQDNARRFSAYLQDSASTGRLAFNVGLRFDHAYQYEPPQSRPELRYDIGPDLLNPIYADTPNILLEALIDQIHDNPNQGISPWDPLDLTKTKRIVTFTTLSPRIGVVYDVFGTGKTAAKASFSRYNEAVWTAKYNAAQIFEVSSFSYRWNDLNGNGLMDLPSDGDTYALSSYINQDLSYNYYIDDLKPSYTNELILGVDQEVFKNFRIGVQFVYKVSKNIVEDVDMYNGYDPTLTDEVGLVWLPYDATDPGWDGVFGTDDDQDLRVYGLRNGRPTPSYHGINPPEAKRKYWAAILTFDKRMSHRWQLQGSVLYSQFKGNHQPSYTESEGQSAMFDNPNTLINAYGSVAFDRPFQLKIMGTYILPYDIIISAYFQARSGSAWGRTLARVYFPSGFGAQSSYAGSILTEPSGSRWLPSYTNLDLRVEKKFPIRDKAQLGFYVDIFNLAGASGININQNPAAYLYSYREPPSQTLSSTYKRITSVYGVRSIRLGARVTF